MRYSVGAGRVRGFLRQNPARFLVFCVPSVESGEDLAKKRRMVAVCAVALVRKKFKFREHKICEKRFENLVTKSTLFNTTFLKVPKIGHLHTVKKNGLRFERANLAKSEQKMTILFKVRAVFARAD